MTIRLTTDTPFEARARRRTNRRALAFLVGLLLLVAGGRAVAHADQPDVRGAVYAAAAIHDVDPEPLIALVGCETGGTFDADAKGDYRWRGGRYVPTSRGPAQINDLEGTGLYPHFKRHYPDNERTDVEAVADYLARVSSGEWAREGVTLKRWSCSR